MESILKAVPPFMFNRVFVFFFGWMLTFGKNINIATVESGPFASVESIGNMLARLAYIIEFRARQVLLHDIREASGRAAAKKKQYRHQSHGLILA